MERLRCSQAFPVFRIARVAFGHILRSMPDRLAVAEDGEPTGEGDVGADDGEGLALGHAAIKAQAGAAGKSSHRLGLERAGATAARGC
jgi:hypothetical protein